jgi:hypothetical protein
MNYPFNALGKYKEPYIRYDLIYWELSFHYASQKQYNKCLEILKTGHDEGLFYYLRDTGNIFPPYLRELKNLS